MSTALNNNLLTSSAILREDPLVTSSGSLVGTTTGAAAAAAHIKRHLKSASISTPSEYVVPFRFLLEARQSHFHLQVPTQFCFSEKTNEPNFLYFSKLDIIPDFFNQASEAYKLDSIEEDNTPMEFDIGFHVQYGPNQFLQKDAMLKKATFVYGRQDQKPIDYIDSVLEFLGTAVQFQPAPFNMYNPVFFDWTFVNTNDDNALSHDQLINEFIPQNLALLYDEFRTRPLQPGDEVIGMEEERTYNPEDYKTTYFHRNCFTMTSVNPWKFPRAAAQHPGLRIRLHLQPKARFVCSNMAMLQVLGFEWEDPAMQDRLKKAYNQFNVVNGTSKWLTWTATKPPNPKNMDPLKAYTELSLNALVALDKTYLRKKKPIELGLTKPFILTKSEIANDDILFNYIASKAVTNFAWQFNIVVEMDTTTGKFFLPKPDGQRLVSCRIYTNPPYIMRRLGYRPYDYIDNKSEHVTDYLYVTADASSASATAAAAAADEEKAFRKHQKARDKAEILVFDSGAIHILSKQGFLEDYNNLGGQFVASLKPSVPGIMTLDRSSQFLRISEYQSSSRYITLTFQLNTFAQADQSVLLNWPTGATIHGILNSIPAH